MAALVYRLRLTFLITAKSGNPKVRSRVVLEFKSSEQIAPLSKWDTDLLSNDGNKNGYIF